MIANYSKQSPTKRGSSIEYLESRRHRAGYDIENKKIDYIDAPHMSIISDNESRRRIERTKVSLRKSMRRVEEFTWLEDMQPSQETISRTYSLCSSISNILSVATAELPTISAAEENSIDIFWGDARARVLVNVPCQSNEKIFAHLIKEDGETVSYFTDSHYFNIGYLVKEMREST